MKMKVIGTRKVEYTKKATGALVRGLEVYGVRKPTKREEDGMNGLISEKVWLGEKEMALCSHFELGEFYDFKKVEVGNYLVIDEIEKVVDEQLSLDGYFRKPVNIAGASVTK